MRKRSVSIYAKNEEDFLKKSNYEKDDRSKSEQNEIKYFSFQPVSISTSCLNTEQTEEKKLSELFDQINSSFKTKNKEKVFDYVLNFIKENDNQLSFIRAGCKNNMSRSLTYNSLTDLDVNEALQNIIASSNNSEDNNHINFNYLTQSGKSMCSTNSSNKSINTILSQNLEIKDEVLKVMLIGSSTVGKTLLLSSFLDNSFDEKNYIYFPTSGMEIRKIVLKINDKNVRIEFYDTDVNIHQKEITNTFYKICDAFFYIVDPYKIETFEFIKSVHKNIINSTINNTSFYLFGLNRKSKESNDFLTNFCENANITFYNISAAWEFNQKNNSILNYFNNILIRKISKKIKKKKTSKDLDKKFAYTSQEYLSPFSDYNMTTTDNYFHNNSESLITRSKCRRLSYNEKLSKS